jgi:hypothetical protein
MSVISIWCKVKLKLNCFFAWMIQSLVFVCLFFVLLRFELRAHNLRHSTSPFMWKDSQTICHGWLWTTILLISATLVARITGVSHQGPFIAESGMFSLSLLNALCCFFSQFFSLLFFSAGYQTQDFVQASWLSPILWFLTVYFILYTHLHLLSFGYHLHGMFLSFHFQSICVFKDLQSCVFKKQTIQPLCLSIG